MSVFHCCLYFCAGVKNINTRDHPWFGPPDACRNVKRDCANNQICNFFPEGHFSSNPNHGNYDESYNWGWESGMHGIGESGCMDCPGTTAESCRDDGGYLNRRTFEDCIEICAGGRNPNNIQFIDNAA